MRLSCANCGAEYEIPDQAIPRAGRDVECSNCDHRWFFAPPMVQSSQGSEPEIEEALRQVLQNEDDAGEPVDQPPSISGEQRGPSGLTPEVAEILRQEAQFEAAARSIKPAQDAASSINEAQIFEAENASPAQPDESPDPDQRSGSEEASVETSPPDQTEAEHDPIEPEQDDAAYPEPDPLPAKSSRRRVKFWSRAAFVALVILVGLYVFDAAVVRVIPESQSALEGYVAWIDKLSVSISGWIKENLPGFSPAPAGPAG